MKVSVIVPVYNASAFIEKCIDSILEQPEVHEIILIDDGSTDDSNHKCVHYSSSNHKIVLLTHENKENKGAAASRNLGIAHASTEYIAFLDADDYYLPDRFKICKKLFNQYRSIDGVYESIGTTYKCANSEARYTKINKPKVTTTTKVIDSKNLFFELVIGDSGYFSLNGLCLRRKSVFDIRFDETLRSCQDTDYIWRVSLVSTLIPGSINNPIAMRYVHENNSIFLASQIKKMQVLMYYKWLLMLRNYNWPRKVNRTIVSRYISYKSKGTTIGKLLTLCQLLLSYPWLIKKVI